MGVGAAGERRKRAITTCAAPRRTPRRARAASLPDTSTMGTPTPGSVDDPVNTSPGARRLTLFGRKGPVWKNVWASANGVPCCIPMRSQSVGSYTSSTTTSVGYPSELVRRRRSSTIRSRSLAQSIPPVRLEVARLGVGSSTYRLVQPAGASVGSSRLCKVTRIDGSGIRTPSSMSARNEPSQSPPKWML